MSDAPHDPPSGVDPFEARLHAQLSDRASTATVPDDGLDRIRRRVHRRSTNRRFAFGGALALLVVVVLVSALAVVRDDGADQGFVDVGAAGGVPFLGFENDTWRVLTYAPGSRYAAADDALGPSDVAIALLVTNDASLTGTESVTYEADRTVPSRHGELHVGTVRFSGGGQAQASSELVAVWWAPAPGWTASLYANSTDRDTDPNTLIEAVDRVAEVDRPTWERHLQVELVDGSLADHPALVLPPSAGTTQVLLATLDFALLWLVPNDGGPAVAVTALAPGVQSSHDGPGTALRVRGQEGWLDTDTGRPEPALLWTEDGRNYSLHLAPGMAPEDAVALADRLRPATTGEWEALLFPKEPKPYPAELVDRDARRSPSAVSGTVAPFGSTTTMSP